VCVCFHYSCLPVRPCHRLNVAMAQRDSPNEMLWAPWQAGNNDLGDLQLTRFMEHLALAYPSFRDHAVKAWRTEFPSSSTHTAAAIDAIDAASASGSPAAMRDALVGWLRMSFHAHDADACQALYALLHRWSIHNLEEFWTAVWHTSGLTSPNAPPTASLCATTCDLTQFPGAKWFQGCTLNIAENMLAFRDDRPAITSANEAGELVTTTYKELYVQVSQAAAALRAHGVRKGDFVCAIVRNDAQAVGLMLATTAIGAVWSSCPPDFGPASIASRFEQVGGGTAVFPFVFLCELLCEVHA
jgi:hypothetical protein